MYALYNLYVPFKIMQAANSISMYPYTIRVQKMQGHCFSKISTCLTTVCHFASVHVSLALAQRRQIHFSIMSSYFHGSTLACI